MKIKENEKKVTDKELIQSRKIRDKKIYKTIITEVEGKNDNTNNYYTQYTFFKLWIKVLMVLLFPVQCLLSFGVVIKEDFKDLISELRYLEEYNFYRKK